MRWLLLKDLQILRRSPLVTALLVIYPIVIAVLIGFALSRGPSEPRVAFLNEIPADEEFSLGGDEELSKDDAKARLCERVECVDVSSREEAERYGQRLLVLADGEALFDGTSAQLHAAVPESGARDFEGALVAFLRGRGH